MFKKMIYLTSLVLVLSLTNEGWPKASNPMPPDGVVHEDTWVSLSWRAGEDAASFDIYIGDNYDDVKHGTGDTFRGNQDLHTRFFIVGFHGYPYPNGLVPGTTYYWRVDEINDSHPDSPWVGDVWSFKIPASTAYDPEPADGAELVESNVILSWEPGYRAKLHTVYFGDSFAEVNRASEGRPQGSTTYDPGLLELGMTYYWRVDESDGLETHKGDVWSFTVGIEGPPPDREEGIIYIDVARGNDRNNGLTPRTAFATIQRGIDVAADGVVIMVYPGLYLEEINFLGKTLTVQGVAVSPGGVPVLWNPDDFAVSFYNGEGPDSIMKNFIIRDSFMGVFIVDSSPTISNLTIVGNTYGIEAYANSEPIIINTILWNNTDGDLFGCRASYSCVERGGEGNITDDPLFVDPDNDDYHIRSERGRYWPRFDIWVLDRVTSPCVDAGDPAADISNEPIPNGGLINIGAYGGTTEASLSPGEQPRPLSDKASNPDPADESFYVGEHVTLSWTAGLKAVSHDVYFSIATGSDDTGIDAVANADTSDTTGIYRGRQTATSYTLPEDIDIGSYTTSCYWRIDEVDSEGNITKGDVWTFSTTSLRPPKGRTCFTAETNVWSSSALVPISKIALGQSIRGMNSLSKIQEVQEHKGTFTCYDVMLESGNCIGVAENHYFLAESGQWISLHDLKAGIKLKTSKGSIGIGSVTKRPMPYVGKVYNLKVEGSDRYLVGKDAIIVRDY